MTLLLPDGTSCDKMRADLLALVGDVHCICVTFPCGILGQVWYLVVSLPDLCRLSYFYTNESVFLSKGHKSFQIPVSVSEFWEGGELVFRPCIG